MLKTSRTILCDLEEELRIKSSDYDNPIKICDKSIKSIDKTFSHLQRDQPSSYSNA